MNGRAEDSATIGVYDGEYCGSFHIESALTCMRLRYETFSDDDVLRPEFGEGFSALVFGAGHVFDSQTALGGAVGKQRIRDLISDGRDYIGICAGAYLALLDPPKGLGLARRALDHPEPSHIFQGFLSVQCLGKTGEAFPVWYQNGPVFSRNADGVMLRFSANQMCHPDADLSSNDLAPRDFEDRPAAVASRHGEGRCVLLSPHLELGSLGIPGFCALVDGWMAERFPEEHKKHPDRVPIGPSRQRFLQEVPALGLREQANGLQWSVLRDILLRAMQEY